ncbi:MAG: 2Fe-2S iron-sulfur cluster binding domain-containing protein [Verrucomicrobiae bacterium]|nr:2Fe-2S iron-sulfur cluster binding domain-containing protein [Verrucomicrobiae bacterium]
MSDATKTEQKPAAVTLAVPVAPQLVKLTIDGREVEVPKGTNVIQAAAKLGIFVPHYCYHPRLSVAGNCRMCLIEMGMPKMKPDKTPEVGPDGKPVIMMIPRPQIGCATTVAPGMVIKTNTPQVKQMQQGVLEFLLLNHPLDCPICDQAGECRLQEFSVQFGQGESRFVDEKVKKPKNVPLGPRVALDDERCILCSRCVRFMKEVAKDDCLGFTQRGSFTTLSCWPGKKLESNYSLNTVDICPVGALTSEDFRFKMRVWFLKETKSICTSCATGCNTIVGSREGVMYRYEPRDNEDVNKSWMCDSGRLNYKWINREDRLTVPTKLLNLKQERIEWAQAIREIADSLKNAGKGSVGFIGSARATNEELFLFRQLARHFDALTDVVPRVGEADNILLSADRNPNTNGAKLTGVAGETPGSKLKPMADVINDGKITHLVVLGENIAKYGIPAETLQKLKLLVVIDILPSVTTKLAHYVLPGVAHVEKRGTFTNGKDRVQKVYPAWMAKGEAREEWLTLNELLVAVGAKVDLYKSLEQVWGDMAKHIPAFRGLSLGKIPENGVQVQM